MNKNAIEKKLLKGTPKQRALLLANHLSEVNLGGKGYLSEAEVTALTSSFGNDSEIKLYNLYNRRFRIVGTYLSNLSQSRLSYKEGLERLEKHLLLRMSNDDFEDAVNSLLDLMPDKKIREKGLKLIKSFNRLPLYRQISPDEAGLIRIHTIHLDSIIEELRKRVRQEQVSLKTCIQALKDYLRETGFNVRVFKAFLKEVEDWAKSNKSMSLTLMSAIEHGPLVSFDEFEANRRNQLLEKYKLEADYERVQIDKDIYDRVMRDELNA